MEEIVYKQSIGIILVVPVICTEVSKHTDVNKVMGLRNY